MTTPVVENEPRENTGASDTDSMTMDASAGSVQHSWPSPVWEKIETLKVFQTLPQNPHFRPLSECPEISREGNAIGLMITFATLVKNIGSLNLEDPRSTYDSCLETLGVLEMNGFDIVSMKDRVNKFLSVKDMLNESAEAANNARKLNAVTGALVGLYEKKVMELQEDRVNKFLSVKDMLNESVEAANNARKLNAVTRALVDHYEKKIMELQEEFAAAKSEVLSLVG